MIERIDEGVLVSCDSCSNELELRLHTIERVNEAAERHGWKAHEDGRGHWSHTCPVCQEERVEHVKPR